MPYKHTQIGYVMIILMPLAALFFMAINQMILPLMELGDPWLARKVLAL